MIVKVEVDSRTAEQLVKAAVLERRPVHFQAEVMLMRALGTWEEPKQPPADAQPKPANEQGRDSEQ